MEPVYYNVESEGKYKIIVKPCTKLEELSDSFITWEKLQELSHDQTISSDRMWQAMDSVSRFKNLHPTGETHYKVPAIQKALRNWLALVKPGKNSTSVTNPEIEELRDEVSIYILNCILAHLPMDYAINTGWTIGEKKLYNANAKRKSTGKRADRILQRDYKDLHKLMRHAILEKYSVYLNLDLTPYNKVNEFALMKHLVSWNDILNTLKSGQRRVGIIPNLIPKQDIPYIKKLYVNPSLIDS